MGRILTLEAFKEKIKKLNEKYSQYEKEINNLQQKMKNTKEEIVTLENEYILSNFRSSGKSVEEYIIGITVSAEDNSNMLECDPTEKVEQDNTVTAVQSVNKSVFNTNNDNLYSTVRSGNFDKMEEIK